MRRLYNRLKCFIQWCLLAVCIYPLAASAKREVVFLTLEYPPYSSESMPNKGVAVEILQMIFAGTEWTPKVKFVPWSRVSRELQFGRADGALMLWPEELKQYNISPSPTIFNSRLGFYVRVEDFNRLNANLASMEGQRVCTARGYGYPSVLHSSGLILDEAISDEVNLKHMSIGRCDFVAVERAVGEYILMKPGNEALRKKVVWIEPAFAELPLTFGITPGKKDSELLLAALEEGLVRLQKNPAYLNLFKQFSLDHGH